ncbi:ABC transporter substrate-binding protein [Oligoflexus tunisiensis]|uniref:ABC transporter substrate-binding protein n=1 Tax=Oligoflexus tunisiensis TaxID=708132 RepID=UPI00114CBA74|nr:ABC transporter substrate-binding protein [Oligoflexus tunisiensis]
MIHKGLVLSGFIGLLLLSACTCEAPLRLRVGMMRNAGCSPLALAVKQRIFQEHNLEVDVQTLDDAAGFAASQFDLVCMNLADLLVQPLDYRVVSIPGASHGADVLVARKDAGIALKDLKGARIGVTPVSMGHLLLMHALRQHQLAPENFTVLPLESRQLEEALRKSEIQLAVAAPPVSLSIMKHPNIQVLFRSAEIPGMIVDVVAVRAEIFIKWPQLAAKLEKTWQDLEAWRGQHAEQALTFMAKSAGLPKTTLQQDYKFLSLTEQRAYLYPEGQLLPLIQELQTSLLQTGSLETPHDPSRFLFIPTAK